MGRTLRRSWLAAEPAPVASTSLMAPSSSTATTTELLDDWSFSYLPASSSTVPSTTEQIRRSVLPSSSATDQREPPWRTHATTTFGGFTSEAENGASTGIDSNNIRISRAARASWNAAFNDPSDFPASSSMLPPRLGTPVPSASTSAETLLAPLQSAIGQLGRRNQPGDLTFDEDLTSIGRRARARQDGTSESSNTGSSVSSLVHSLNLETLERAQLAVEGSRIALEEARLAIRTALRNSETRLGRLADLIRVQLQDDTNVPLPPIPRTSEVSDIEAERNEYNLERSLANLRSASLEIDRVLAAPTSTASTPTLTSSSQIPANYGSRFSRIHTRATEAVSQASSPLEFPRLTEATLPDPSLRLPLTLREHLSIPPSDPWQAVTPEPHIRQPMPRRPIRYLRASQITSNGTSRPRSLAQDTSSSRPGRSQRPNATRSAAVQVSLVGYASDSTSSLARNVLTNFAQRSTTSDEEALLLSDEDDNRLTGTLPARSVGYRQPGRWIRLDANGDEIVDDGNSSTAPLGWSWAAALQTQGQSDEKIVVGDISATSETRTYMHSTVQHSSEGPLSRDMVGR